MVYKKLGKNEEEDWAWSLIGMTPSGRRKTMEKIERDYSPTDVNKIKKAFIKLAKA
jgi:hypothetical protein